MQDVGEERSKPYSKVQRRVPELVTQQPAQVVVSLASGHVVIQMFHRILLAQQRLDVVNCHIHLNAGVKDAVRVEDLLYLLEQAIYFLAVKLLQVWRPQPAVIVLATGAATHINYHPVIIVNYPEYLLPVTDLAKVQEGLHVQISVAGVAPEGSPQTILLEHFIDAMDILLEFVDGHYAVLNDG